MNKYIAIKYNQDGLQDLKWKGTDFHSLEVQNEMALQKLLNDLAKRNAGVPITIKLNQ